MSGPAPWSSRHGKTLHAETLPMTPPYRRVPFVPPGGAVEPCRCPVDACIFSCRCCCGGGAPGESLGGEYKHGRPLAVAGGLLWLAGSLFAPYCCGGTLTPFPVAAYRRSGTNNGMNAPPNSNSRAAEEQRDRHHRGSGQEVATAATTQRKGYRHDKRESSAPGRAGYGVRFHHTTYSGVLVPDKPCHAVTR
jgi:hypothetical protein